MHLGVIGTRAESVVVVRALKAVWFWWIVTVYSDWKRWPIHAKSESIVRDSFTESIKSLEKAWATHCIVSPRAECSRYDTWSLEHVPLFELYCKQFACRYSLVGKMWVLWGSQRDEQFEDGLREILGSYTLSDSQQSTKLFHTSWKLRTVDCSIREILWTHYSNRHPLVRRTVRTSLRRLRDAWVDTLIPMSRWTLYFQRIVTQQTSWKKMRLHGSDALEELLWHYLKERWAIEGEGEYRVMSSDPERDVLCLDDRFKNLFS